MKCINLIYKKADNLIKVKHDLKDYLPGNILIQVFCGISDIDMVNNLRSLLCEVFPGSAVIGASSAGELLNANIVEKSIVISFAAFKTTKVRSALIDQNDDLTAGGKDMGSILDDNEIKAVIVLGCGLKGGNYVNAFPFIKALNCTLGNTIIAGGLAGGYHEQASRVFVFTEHHLTEHGFVAATLCGPDLCVNTAHNLSWMPIGKRMTITHVKGRRIYSIDGKSVKDVYRQYLGIDAHPSSISVINHFPLMVQRRNMLVTNPVLSVNTDGSFSVLEKLKEPGGWENNWPDTNRKLFSYIHVNLEKIFLKTTFLRIWPLYRKARPRPVFLPLANVIPTVIKCFISYNKP